MRKQTAKPKAKKVSWKSFDDAFLKSLTTLPREEVKKAIKAKTGAKTNWTGFLHELGDRGMRYEYRSSRKHVADRLSSDEKEAFKKAYPGGTYEDVQKSIEKSIPKATPQKIHAIARKLGVLGQRTHLKGTASTFGKEPDKNKPVVETISSRELLENLPLEERKWDDPEVLDITEEQWQKSGVRVGLISGIAFLNEGRRDGLVYLGFQDLRNEPTQFNLHIGHLIDKDAFQEKIAERMAQAKEHLRQERATKKLPKISDQTLKERVVDQLVDETAKALAAIIPKIRKPKSAWEKRKGQEVPMFVRLYIITSEKYDGPYGELVAQKLQTLRNDIRLTDSDQLEVKGFGILGALAPRKNRMPSAYYSTAAEKEIKEREGQMTQNFPDFWAIGPFAASVFIPNGVHERPYVMTAALRKLEEVTVAENQVGILVLEYRTKGELPLVRIKSYRDLIKQERFFINPPRGANEIQQGIVRILQNRGGQSVGLIEDHLPKIVSREKIEEEIQGLVEPKGTKLKTWPGLFFNPRSQKYNFHLDWIQERLRYPEIKGLQKDSMLFFGCLHAGYNTTDYEHWVKEIPRIILEQDVQHLFGMGDMVAGLHHNFLCTGEVFGNMNYTEQEIFAAELLATALLKVFSVRFEALTKGKNLSATSPEELVAIVRQSLVQFDFIPGNHDLWQEGEGHTPLVIFSGKLVELLMRNISRIFIEYRVPFFDLLGTILNRLNLYADYGAQAVTLPSGIRVAMQHPHMGNAQTSTLRAQNAFGFLGSQVSAIANFHSATVVHQWRPDLGQCVVVQVGTQAIYTRFERRKMKRSVDFGPILLKVLSHDGRIQQTETAYFNKPYLTSAILKTTDPAVLKKKLGIVTV